MEVITTKFEFTILRLYDQVVLGFSDDSSAECREIFKKYEKAANHTKCQKVLFLKADLKEAQEVFEDLNITSTPVFLFFKNEEMVDELFENDAEKLQKKIMKIMK